MAMYCRKLLLFYSSLFIAVGIANSVAAGGLYSCKDKDGKTSYTSVPKGKCRVISAENKKTKKKSSKSSTEQQSVTDFSIISAKKQSKRDIKRSDILLYELRREIKQREEIKQTIPKTKNNQKLAVLKDRYEQNELNIVAIKKQLERLGFEIKTNKK